MKHTTFLPQNISVSFEAITPEAYKQQAHGLLISYAVHQTAFGLCFIAVTARGICQVSFLDTLDDAPQAVASLQEQWEHAQCKEDVAATKPLVDQIFSESGIGETKPFHLYVKGTNFQVKVWQALLTIPSGTLVSYEHVAHLIGQPTATRAVAHAIARNDVSVLIPCHRVIKKSGQIHAYRWGTARKKALIAHEAIGK